MFERLEARARDIALRGAETTRRRLAAAARQAFPDLEIGEDTRGVRIAGRALWRRMRDDPRLRWIAGLIR
ncbi:hypothetical protein [Sphingomonas sp. C3-2]|uniref:hypothetical protein n=1 Tax=Sphingomonas sp. C3-2 TaxID=3062169 RepID=UPI00294B9944|nr:hypothetical protein [Sphingomonas sp. C3-2]WOK36304.1 hypothetical protein QYC26_15060 [Sphingomonas sp. C3-2]